MIIHFIMICIIIFIVVESGLALPINNVIIMKFIKLMGESIRDDDSAEINNDDSIALLNFLLKIFYIFLLFIITLPLIIFSWLFYATIFNFNWLIEIINVTLLFWIIPDFILLSKRKKKINTKYYDHKFKKLLNDDPQQKNNKLK